MGCDRGEVGKCAAIRVTKHFSRDPDPLGRLLPGAHPLCCPRRPLAIRDAIVEAAECHVPIEHAKDNEGQQR